MEVTRNLKNNSYYGRWHVHATIAVGIKLFERHQVENNSLVCFSYTEAKELTLYLVLGNASGEIIILNRVSRNMVYLMAVNDDP